MNIGNLIRCGLLNIASMGSVMDYRDYGSVNLGWLILHTGNYKLPRLSIIYMTTWYISGDPHLHCARHSTADPVVYT